MKITLTLLLLAVSQLTAIADGASVDTPPEKTDHIFLKDVDGNLGYVMIPGEVEAVTRNYVLFVQDGFNITYLYTRDDVRRIELGKDDEEFRPIVDRHWNDKDIFDRGERPFLEWASDLITSLLPSAILIGFLVLVCMYFLASTLLQAYQRFVLEGNIKRLNTEKLLSEIDKLRVEVLEMRQRLGFSISEEELLSSDNRLGHKDIASDRGIRPLEKRVSLPFIHLPEIHFIDFVKNKILDVRTPEEFEARKQSLVDHWEIEKDKNAGWLKMRYFAYSSMITAAIWFGWIFALGLIGNIVLYFTENSYREELGDGFAIFFIVMCTVLIVAVIRLGQKRKLRKSAYQQVFLADKLGN